MWTFRAVGSDCWLLSYARHGLVMQLVLTHRGLTAWWEIGGRFVPLRVGRA
jgi:hypothetical protein